MAKFEKMFEVNNDGTISDQPVTVDVNVFVEFWDHSVSGTARWGQSIGTTAMRSCHGAFIINNRGAWLCHNLAGDKIEVPTDFSDASSCRIDLFGAAYDTKPGIFMGRQCYAFKLNEKKPMQIYVSSSSYVEPVVKVTTPHSVNPEFIDFSTLPGWDGKK